MLPDGARAIIEGGALGHLATVNEDGTPHVTCAWVGVRDGYLAIATLFDQHKLQNMRREPSVTVSFEGTETNEYGLREYVVVYGRAEVTEGGAPELLQELARTYLGPEVKFPPMDDPPSGFVTKITPTRVTGVGPWSS